MTRVIAIGNQKGGVGKSTTTLHLGYGLAHLGRQVLMIDLDPQSSLTFACGVKGAEGSSMAELLGSTEPGTVTLRQIVRKMGDGLYLAPSDIALSRSEAGLLLRRGREGVLGWALAGVKTDYVLIDCPPSLGLLTVNALTAADEVVIPTICEYLALRGIALFLETVEEVREYLNPELKVLGVIPTFYDGRLIHTQAVLDALEERGLPIFNIQIRRTVRLAEAALAHQPLFDYAPGNPNAIAYQRLAEVVDHG